MKKTIILNIIMILSLALLIVAFIIITRLNYLWNVVGLHIIYLSGDILDKAKEFEISMYKLTIPNIFLGIGILINIITLIIIDLPIIKSLMTSNKQAALADKAEADKQARIAKLESELEELKKN